MPEDSPSTRKCRCCGNDFSPYRSWQEYCSPSCRNQYYERYVRHSCGEALKILDEGVGTPEQLKKFDSFARPPDESDSKNEKSAGG